MNVIWDLTQLIWDFPFRTNEEMYTVKKNLIKQPSGNVSAVKGTIGYNTQRLAAVTVVTCILNNTHI